MNTPETAARVAEIKTQREGNGASWIAYGKINEDWALHAIDTLLDLLAEREKKIAALMAENERLKVSASWASYD